MQNPDRLDQINERKPHRKQNSRQRSSSKELKFKNNFNANRPAQPRDDKSNE